MRMIIQATIVALMLGAASGASAHDAPAHRRHAARDYNALGQTQYRPAPTDPAWSVPQGTDDGTLSTLTGGPAGGLGS